MSNSIPSDTRPAILRGSRFTTNNACLPSTFGGVRPLLFHADADGAGMVAKVDTQLDEMVRLPNHSHGLNGPDADIDLLENFSGNGWLDRSVRIQSHCRLSMYWLRKIRSTKFLRKKSETNPKSEGPKFETLPPSAFFEPLTNDNKEPRKTG